MAFKTRSNAVQNVNNYLGKFGANIKRFILVFVYMFWFTFQLRTTLPFLENYFNSESLILLGGCLAFFTAILSMGGIRLIKWACVLSFPLIFMYYPYAISISSFDGVGKIGLSIEAMIATVLALLPFTINSPTFFRHSRSRADSYLALTIMTIFISFFQISTIWMNPSSKESYFTLFFILWILFSTNLLNIYTASMSFEGLSEKFQGAKVYLTLGLLGTLAYLFIPISSTSITILNLMNSYIASLGTVLCIAFFIRSLVGYKPHSREKHINIFCWLMGCLVATILIFQYSENSVIPLLAAMGTSLGCYFCILFIKENIWSARKLRDVR